MIGNFSHPLSFLRLRSHSFSFFPSLFIFSFLFVISSFQIFLKFASLPLQSVRLAPPPSSPAHLLLELSLSSFVSSSLSLPLPSPCFSLIPLYLSLSPFSFLLQVLSLSHSFLLLHFPSSLQAHFPLLFPSPFYQSILFFKFPPFNPFSHLPFPFLSFSFSLFIIHSLLVLVHLLLLLHILLFLFFFVLLF